MKAQETNKKGHFLRQSSQFRNFISSDQSSLFKPDQIRYHLYISYACPWAHRVLMVRALRGLEAYLPVSCVDYLLKEDGWFFSDREGATCDHVYGMKTLKQLYEKAKPDYEGRYTVPVLWDKQTHMIVNNESREIIVMLEKEFQEVVTKGESLYPEHSQDKIDSVIDEIYEPINNGVYKCGFAQTQEAYEESIQVLFEALEYWNDVLADQAFLCGDTITLADICLFPTLFRFDLVYIAHFKCNVRRLVDFPHLFNFVQRIYQLPGVADTCDINQIKKHYFMSHPQLNPLGIVPVGPDINFSEPVI